VTSSSRFARLAVLRNGDYRVSSETEPSIRIYDRNGVQIASLPIPAWFAVTGVTGQVIVVGYGSRGRAVIRALSESGVQKRAIVVIDPRAEAVAEANAAGLAAVAGDGTRSEVLREAKIGSARQVVIAVRRAFLRRFRDRPCLLRFIVRGGR